MTCIIWFCGSQRGPISADVSRGIDDVCAQRRIDVGRSESADASAFLGPVGEVAHPYPPLRHCRRHHCEART